MKSRAEQELEEFNKVFAALSHPTANYFDCINGEKGRDDAGEIVERFSWRWPIMTRHLKQLEEAKLIGVKLPDEKTYKTLLDETRATPWKAGLMTMAHWVLVRGGYHSKPSESKKWVKLAHKLCFDLPTKKPAKKKTATKAKKKKG